MTGRFGSDSAEVPRLRIRHREERGRIEGVDVGVIVRRRDGDVQHAGHASDLGERREVRSET